MSTTLAPVAGAAHKQPDFSLFDQYRSKFRQLYLEQNKSLAQVKREMETDHGFPKTDAKTYEYGLLHLGFVKKLSIEKWVEVEVRAKERKEREGKETDVFLSGVLQPWDKINRCISRHKRRKQLRERIGRRPTPDWPEGVSLRTPSPPPNMMIINSRHDATQILFPSIGVSTINIEGSTILNFQQLLDGLWTQMVSNPNSAVHLLTDVPSSQLMKIFRQTVSVGSLSFQDQEFHEINALSFPWDFAPAHDIAPISRLHQGLVYDDLRENSIIPAQLHFLEGLSKICMILANDREMEITDPRRMLAWVGMDANKSVLKAFFALELPAVAAAWTKLIELSRNLKSGDAFQTLVEIGFETHNGEWIRQHARILIISTASLGSGKAGKIAQRLLSSELVRRALRSDLDCSLWDIAQQLDIEMMSKFVHAGVNFKLPVGLLGQWSYGKFYETAQFHRTLTNRQQLVYLLKTAGFNFDCRIESSRIINNVFIQFDHWYDDAYRTFGGFATPTYLLDRLWISGECDVYEAMIVHSERAKTQITIPGLIMAAHSGAEQLQLYLDSRQVETHASRRILFETALSVAAGQGDVAAIQSFGEAKVDPNARMLLSKAGRFKLDWHPLMRAAGAKHLDAVRMLVEMGAETRSEIDFFNPLSAAIWKLRPLSNMKRLEQLKTVRYFLGKDLVHTYGVDAIVKAAIPTPRLDRYDILVPPDDFVPDEEVIDMLLEAGIDFDGIMEEDKDLLHLAIDRSCNLRTVEFLVSRGLQIHSRRCLRDGKTMLHSAAASVSRDRRKIVEFLLQRGASCTKEWGGPTILESALFGVYNLAEPKKDDLRLQLFSFLLSSGAQVNGPKKRLSNGIKGSPISTLLLYYKAPDALIYQTIQAGADINSEGFSSRLPYTPLQFAALIGRLDVARQLVIRGADINAPALLHGRTALQAACCPRGEVEIPLGFIQFLLGKGADINAPGADFSGATALQWAIMKGTMSCFCLLLDAGADVNATAKCGLKLAEGDEDDDEYSALDVAAWGGRLDMVDILVRKGAESQEQGKTPYDGAIRLAKKGGNFAIAKMLENKFSEQH
ncbi:ankyrin [Xylariaceae sp. AK1471]|nr:ankyrin [Xylariaceae sp. AK1471]